MSAPGRRPGKRILAVVVGATTAAGLGGCRRHETNAAPAPSASSLAVHHPDAPEADRLSALVAEADLRVEARRGTVAASDPMLAPKRAALERHFGTVADPLRVQVARTAPNHTAVFLEASRGEPHPLLWLVTDAGDLAWEKEHPTGGVKPGVTEPVVAPGPEHRIALSWCNGATSSVALRQWTDEGDAFADFEALHYDTCDALSVLYWPHHGWLIAVANRSGALLQLVGENGDGRWGRDGSTLPWIWRAPAAVSFGLDTEDTVLLFRFGASGAPGSAEYVFAERYDPSGRALWPGPLSIQKLSEPPEPTARIALFPAPNGSIGVKSPTGSPLLVSSDGTVQRH